MDLKNIKIGVLGGGVSPEREISLISANQVYKALSARGLEAVFIDIQSSQRKELEELLVSKDLGVVFIALHGEFGEDGGIQQILQDLGIAYTGSDPEASSLAMNKPLAKERFKQSGISTPQFQVFSQNSKISLKLACPLVVKPYRSGSSLGVSIVREGQKLKPALDEAFNHQDIVLVEEYIEGRELTVGILDQQPLGIVEIIPKRGHYDFAAKYSDGLTEFIAPAKLLSATYQDIQNLSLSAHRALGCKHFSRVDLRLDNKRGAYVLEVNSIPGLTSHSLLPLSAKVCSIEFEELVLKMIELALRRSAVSV